MRILLTNYSLDQRAGSELYLRDVTLALLTSGHEPVVYSPTLGDVAAELRSETVVVLDDLANLAEPPDLIHGQHHLTTMTALARFPETPAIYLCHGWLPDAEAPPRHPRIRRYVAVDALVEKRLVDECGIPRDQVETLLNFVDLDRFKPRAPLPREPLRVLAFSNYVSNSNCLPAIREACGRRNLSLTALGQSSGNTTERPESELGRYDIVLAKGRSALEAIAVGNAVVVCDRDGLATMVTRQDFSRMRDLNFGVRLLRKPITVENLLCEFDRYDHEDASQCTELLRQGVGLDRYTQLLTDLYEKVVHEQNQLDLAPSEDALATAHYLRWGPLHAGDLFHGERRRLHREAAEVRVWAKHLDQQAQQAHSRIADLETRLHAKEEERQQLLAASLEGNQRNHEIHAQLEAALEHQGGLERQVTELEQELSSTAHRAVEQEQRNARLEGEQHQFENRARRAEGQVVDLRQELSKTSGVLQEIVNTRVWRCRERVFGQRWLSRLLGPLSRRRSKTRTPDEEPRSGTHPETEGSSQG